MIIAPLKYLTYRIRSSNILNKKTGYHNSLLSNETLVKLKQRIKHSVKNELDVVVDLSTKHLNIGENINQVFGKYGCPTYLKSFKSKGVTHEVVLYKRMIRGQKSKVIYNFINGNTASIEFKITISNKLELKKVTSFLKETYFNQSEVNFDKSLSIVDKNENRLLFENDFDVSLTYINHNTETIQIINSAVYNDKYKEVKYAENEKFQLTF